MKSKAVFIVDMQDSYLCNLPIKETMSLIGAINHTINKCVINDIPIFVSKMQGCGPTNRLIIDALKNYKHVHYLKKDSASAFASTNILRLLHSSKIDYIFVMGINADACVYATVKHALSYCLNVSSNRNVVGAKSGESGVDAFIQFLSNKKHAHVSTFEEFLVLSKKISKAARLWMAIKVFFAIMFNELEYYGRSKLT